MPIIAKEIWKPVFEAEGKYEVSDYGNVRSVKRVINGKNKSHKLLKFNINDSGYRMVKIYYPDGRVKSRTVHRLLATAFFLSKNKEAIINHIDGDKQNNCIENLEWCTQSYNIQHAFMLGLKVRPKGEANNQSKLTDDSVYEIRILLKANYSCITISTYYNVSSSLISHIKRNVSWPHIQLKANN